MSRNAQRDKLQLRCELLQGKRLRDRPHCLVQRRQSPFPRVWRWRTTWKKGRKKNRFMDQDFEIRLRGGWYSPGHPCWNSSSAPDGPGPDAPHYNTHYHISGHSKTWFHTFTWITSGAANRKLLRMQHKTFN